MPAVSRLDEALHTYHGNKRVSNALPHGSLARRGQANTTRRDKHLLSIRGVVALAPKPAILLRKKKRGAGRLQKARDVERRDGGGYQRQRGFKTCRAGRMTAAIPLHCARKLIYDRYRLFKTRLLFRECINGQQRLYPTGGSRVVAAHRAFPRYGLYEKKCRPWSSLPLARPPKYKKARQHSNTTTTTTTTTSNEIHQRTMYNAIP